MRRLLPIIAGVIVAACQSDRPPTSPPSFLIQDAAHSNGNKHFYWLPPMEPQPTFTGTFNATLSPVVEISELPPCGTQDIIATFTMSTGPGGEKVGIDVAGQKYLVNWHTNAFSLKDGCTYRISVSVSGLPPLGFADVQVASTGAGLKRVDTQQYVPLLDDRTLPIKFRIEDGALFFAATGDDACRPGRDCGEAIVTGGQAATVLTTQKLAGVSIPFDALSAGRQIAVTIEQRTDRPCIPTIELAVPQFDDCYRYVAVDAGGSEGEPLLQQASEGERNPFFKFDHNVTVGMCVEVGLLTAEQAKHLEIFRFDQAPDEGFPRVTSLPDEPATFLPCDPGVTIGTRAHRGFLGRGWDVVTRFLGLNTAYASSAMTHIGLGGSSCCLSYFTWGLPGTMSKNSTDPQGQGSPVTAPPSVRVISPGEGLQTPIPVPGATVTFEVGPDNGDIQIAPGTFGSTVQLLTVDGAATVQGWRLDPLTPKTNVLTARLPGASPSQVTFTAGLIVQNRADIGCSLLTGGESRGYGYRIEFNWAAIPGATGYVIEAQRGTAPPIVSQTVEGTQFTFTDCNSFVADMNLDGWQWHVRTTDEGAQFGPPVTFSFLPCRLDDGSACNAPPTLQ